jgi:hypothetical protein
MSNTRRRTTHRSFASLLTEYAAGDEFVIPEDLTSLSDEDLAALQEEAVSNFDALYGDGSGLSEADVEALSGLTAGIEAINAEVSTRAEATAARETAAAELANRIRPPAAEAEVPVEPVEDPPADDDGEDDGEGEPAPGDGEPAAPTAITPATPEAIAASGRGDIRVNLSGVRSRSRTHRPVATVAPRTMRDLVFAAGEGSVVAAGTGIEWDQIGRIMERRLQGYSHSTYDAAKRAGRHMRQQFGVLSITKPFSDDLVLRSNDPTHVDEVMQHAMDEHRLPGGSLVAAGGWCAPSEIIYDLCELESGDGLLSIPEISVARGGIQWTTGPDWSDIWSQTGFCFTEAEDETGAYVEPVAAGDQPNTVGPKPCYTVECPDFQEERLRVCGLCIQSGLLQQRGYPEVLARTVRGALIAHDHKMSAAMIQAMVAGSTPITMTAATVGTAAPLLTAIELQVEHYRYSHRMSRSTTLEAIFPYWVRGAIRSDLALRLGVDLLAVTDAMIDGWFRLRGIAPQYVYDWQPLDTVAADAFKVWPANVQFLLYSAGTWVRGVADVITLDTIYDSTLLANNDFTALFTEDAWLPAKLCVDSRVITVPVCSTGETGGGLDLACDGTAAPVIP